MTSCTKPNPTSTITVHYDYEMLSSVGSTNALLSVDAGIVNYATSQFEEDCALGVVSVTSGRTDMVGDVPCTVLTATDSMDCTAVGGYVSVTYDPAILPTFTSAEALVFRTVADGMGSDGTIAAGINGVGLLQMNGDPGTTTEGVRSQETMSESGPGTRLTPGGKAGLALLGVAFAALVAALVYRRQRNKRRGEREVDGAAAAREEDPEYQASKLQMMDEIDGVVAAVDDDVVKDDDDDDDDGDTNSTGSEDKMQPVNIDDGYFNEAATGGGGMEGGQDGEDCGLEVSMC